MKLKTIIAATMTLGYLAASPLTATAAPTAGESYYGILAGPSLVSYSLGSSGTSAHFSGGIDYEVYWTPTLSIQPDLLYSNKTSGSVSYDYINLPVLFKYHFLTNSMITPNLAFGPDFNINVTGPDGTNTSVFGLDFGAGLDAALNSNTALSFDFRYAFGLTSIIDALDVKTREFYFLFGVKLRIPASGG